MVSLGLLRVLFLHKKKANFCSFCVAELKNCFCSLIYLLGLCKLNKEMLPQKQNIFIVFQLKGSQTSVDNPTRKSTFVQVFFLTLQLIVVQIEDPTYKSKVVQWLKVFFFFGSVGIKK